MALAIPANEDETWCSPYAKSAKGKAVLKAPTIKLKRNSFPSRRMSIFRQSTIINSVVAPRRQRQKARPIGEKDWLANSIKKKEEPQIRPAPK
jgi:hypothetical protein